jgi:hypothetical protein
MAGIEIEEKEAKAKPKAAIPWPKELPAQIAAVRDLIASNPTEGSTALPKVSKERSARKFNPYSTRWRHSD